VQLGQTGHFHLRYGRQVADREDVGEAGQPQVGADVEPPVGTPGGAQVGAENLARFVFTDRRARTAFPDWDRVADEQVATLKQGPFRADPDIGTLTDELTVTAGEAFAGRAETVPGLPALHGVLRLVHPFAGELRLAYETLELPAEDDQRLIVYLAADEATSTALRRLEHPGLRVVAS
jgi:hypothetical protein